MVLLQITDMATKIEIKSDKITPFGGIFSVIREFSPIERLFDSELGLRVKTFGYQYGEIMRAMMCNYFCGGDRMEDIKIYQPGIEYMPGMKLCSPDTMLRAIDELTEANTCYTAESGKSYDFNTSERLNTLMVKAAKQQKLLREGRRYILDFDHKFIGAEKYDTKFSYRGERGYMPGVSILTDMATGDDVIVGVENRDGNANVKFHQTDTLERTFNRLEANGLWATIVRCDCGSYSREIIEAISRHCHRFYIRANMYAALRDSLAEHTNWESVEIDGQMTEVLSLPFISIEGIDHCRLVVQRTKKDTPDLFDGQYVYRAILTNDWDAGEADIILFYNRRGAKEKIFDQMDNDFGWNYLPKSFMNQNAVFLVLSSIIRNFYCGLLRGKRIKAFALDRKSRLKSFISKFLAVPAKWIKRARGYVLNLYTEHEGYREIFDLGFG